MWFLSREDSARSRAAPGLNVDSGDAMAQVQWWRRPMAFNPGGRLRDVPFRDDLHASPPVAGNGRVARSAHGQG